MVWGMLRAAPTHSPRGRRHPQYVPEIAVRHPQPLVRLAPLLGQDRPEPGDPLRTASHGVPFCRSVTCT
ncbi:hypothetical protein BIV23_10240 [Streptomyces monashensis]|uniref:Uncharacterized protein n=1 Tax=Streptomyces monashensis TaxID=1678012 RepID=A0A1S2QJS1_9ACTN|nr:hypothetical protein BIV23_10240 [Streptomyces monashensis]